MDLETFVESLFGFIKNSENMYFLLYAVATCLVSQIAKKLLVNKVKVDVEHKFDLAVVLPFVFGTIFAAVDTFVVACAPFGFRSVVGMFVDGATIGALSSVIFRFVSSLGNKSFKSLMKDDVFGVFYTQLLYFGNARDRLADGTLSYADFLQQVKLVATNARQIYLTDAADDVKRAGLARLLGGIVDETDINLCVNVINRALIANAARRNSQANVTKK